MALVVDQFFDGSRDAALFISNVELNDLVSRSIAVVMDIYLEMYAVVRWI